MQGLVIPVSFYSQRKEYPSGGISPSLVTEGAKVSWSSNPGSIVRYSKLCRNKMPVCWSGQIFIIRLVGTMGNNTILIEEGMFCHPAYLLCSSFALLPSYWEERERCDQMKKRKTKQPDTWCQQCTVLTCSLWPNLSPAGNEVKAK